MNDLNNYVGGCRNTSIYTLKSVIFLISNSLELTNYNQSVELSRLVLVSMYQ